MIKFFNNIIKRSSKHLKEQERFPRKKDKNEIKWNSDLDFVMYAYGLMKMNVSIFQVKNENFATFIHISR